jgi:hypothetical protein
VDFQGFLQLLPPLGIFCHGLPPRALTRLHAPLPALPPGGGGAPPKDSLPIPSLTWGATPAEAGRRDRIACEATGNATERYLCGIDSLGGAALGDCRLEFVEGRLAGVAVTTRGERDSALLLRYLLSRHGPGDQRKYGSLWWWENGTHIAYDVDSAGDACIYWYRMNAPWEP